MYEQMHQNLISSSLVDIILQKGEIYENGVSFASAKTKKGFMRKKYDFIADNKLYLSAPKSLICPWPLQASIISKACNVNGEPQFWTP